MNHPFPKIVWRRPETGDRFEKENGSRVTLACLSLPFRSSQTAYCYTGGQIYAGATQGELPEGQERVPWGTPCRATCLLGGHRRHLRVASIAKRYPAGCGKVNCGNAAREGALGYDLGAPFVNHLHTRNRRGAQCAPKNRLILRCVGAQCAPLRGNVYQSFDTVYIIENRKRADPSGQPFSLSCCFVCRYLMMFSHQRCMIAAISARVAVPVGARRPPFLPFSTPAPTAHCRAGIAYSLAC